MTFSEDGNINVNRCNVVKNVPNVCERELHVKPGNYDSKTRRRTCFTTEEHSISREASLCNGDLNLTLKS